MATFTYRGGEFHLSRTHIMGILNITPDSFSDGGLYTNPDAAVRRALEMEAEGADILDIGACSTRPGAAPVAAAEEWERLRPVLAVLAGKLRIPISVDTSDVAIAEKAIDAGAGIINDVSGGLQNGMIDVAARSGAGLILMFPGDAGHYQDGAPLREVRDFFERAVAAAGAAGLPLSRLCLDPGIGFGSSMEQDAARIARLPELMSGLPDVAVLVGASRKRFLSDGGRLPVNERLPGTIAAHAVAAWNGAHILRVHDVEEAAAAARVVDRLKMRSEE